MLNVKNLVWGNLISLFNVRFPHSKQKTLSLSSVFSFPLPDRPLVAGGPLSYPLQCNSMKFRFICFNQKKSKKQKTRSTNSRCPHCPGSMQSCPTPTPAAVKAGQQHVRAWPSESASNSATVHEPDWIHRWRSRKLFPCAESGSRAGTAGRQAGRRGGLSPIQEPPLTSM